MDRIFPLNESLSIKLNSSNLREWPITLVFSKRLFSLYRIGIFSFTIENFHYYDLGLLLDAKGIAVRTGHHCTQPLMDKYNLDGTARVYLALYNTEQEVDFFVDSVKNLLNRWKRCLHKKK